MLEVAQVNFIGRKEELNTLEKEFRRDGSFVVIYGRRRIGKTTLILPMQPLGRRRQESDEFCGCSLRTNKRSG